MADIDSVTIVAEVPVVYLGYVTAETGANYGFVKDGVGSFENFNEELLNAAIILMIT